MIKFDTPVLHSSFPKFKGREDTAHNFNVLLYGALYEGTWQPFEDFRTGKLPMPPGVRESLQGGVSGLVWDGAPITQEEGIALAAHACTPNGHTYAWVVTSIFQALLSDTSAPPVPAPVPGPTPLKPWFPIVSTRRTDELAAVSPNGPLTKALSGFEITHALIGPSWLIPAAEDESIDLDRVFGGVPGRHETRTIRERILDARLGPSRTADPGEIHLVLLLDAILELVAEGKNVGGGPLGAAHSPVIISAARRDNAQMACHEVYYALADVLKLGRALGREKAWRVSDEYAVLGRRSFEYSNLYRGIEYILAAMTLSCGMIGLRGEYKRNPDTGATYLDADYHDAFIYDDPSIDRTTGSAGFGIGVGGRVVTDDIPR